ncbi:uncharacterized protein LOC131598354 [Vicia villosa]|uniref:uncharacterized protein LOC131598354 n=1 Tax=Vicia villosa TaxID=3911 RepID=UPI00273C059F|nr:uncharacterized protein LOC131598354 [Vicia villosa]
MQDASIGVMGGWKDGCWLWGDLGIPAPTGSGSAAGCLELFQLLSAATVTANQLDSTSWQHEDDRVFSFSSCYNVLYRKYIPFGLNNCYDSAFVAIWKVEVPLKVKVFGWRSFLNKVPTKDLLLNRGILNSSSSLECVFYDDFDESLHHSFLLCRNVAIVWKEMSEWIGLCYISILDFKENFWYWSTFCRAKKVKRGKEEIVLLAILWSIWLRRNDIVFNNSSWNSRDVVWSCKALIWR